MNRKKADMTKGPILGRILPFALPIFIGSVFQMLYNMVDSIIVGRYVGANALAAVGSTATISMVLVGVASGFTTGASVVVAQLVGAGKHDRIKAAISTTITLLVTAALIITVVSESISSNIMHWVKVPQEILADSLAYFRIFLLGVIFLVMYNFFASFLRAMGDSTTPLIFLVISSLLNIAGDLFFVIKLNLAVAGVAIATVLAQAVSVVLCLIYTSRKMDYFHFGKGEFVFDRKLLSSIVRLGIPAGLQSSITGLGMVFVQSLINTYGAVSIAAYTAASKMEGLCNLPMGSIAQAFSIFVGQNIGAGDLKRARKGLLYSDLLAVGISLCMSVVIYAFGPNIMTLFIKTSETEVILIGAAFMRRWAPLIFLHALFEGFVAFLRGSGDSMFAMFSMFADLITRTVMAYVFALGFGMGFMGIAWAIPCGWLGCSIFSMARFFQGGWKTKAVVDR